MLQADTSLRFTALMTALGVAGCLWLSGCQGGEIVDPQELPVVSDRPEICNDSKDNDGDGYIDCSDSECAEQSVCSLGTDQPLNPMWDVCHEEVGDRSHTPIDLIWTVDSSASMTDELRWIQENLNRLHLTLDKYGSDVHIVLIGGSKLCIAQPLGGANCTDGDRFRHISAEKEGTILVGNDDTLTQVINQYDKYRDFLRTGAKKAVVAVSDDNPEDPKGRGYITTADAFDKAVKRLSPPFPNDYAVHSIVSYSENKTFLTSGGCSTGDTEGYTYIELSKRTNGLIFPICTANWTKLFNDLGAHLAALVNVPCTYKLPSGFVDVADGRRAIDPGLRQVSTHLNGQWQILPEISGPGACSDQAGYYISGDNIHLCPTACTGIAVQQVKVFVGCKIEVDM